MTAGSTGRARTARVMGAGGSERKPAVIDLEVARSAFADREPRVSAGLDVGELYRSLSRSLERIVRAGVKAPDYLIEEACQYAWARLVHHRAEVRREKAQAWLVQTARREAFKLAGRALREASLEAELDESGEICTPDPRPGPAEVCEQRDRLHALSTLSRRQQRLLWLYALGLGYEEVAAHDGCSSRTVERQLHRARAALWAAEAE